MKQLTFLFLIICITTACSNDDSGNNFNPNNPEKSDFKFISTIISDPTEFKESPYDYADTLVYKDGKLFKAYIGAYCRPGFISQYEYGGNGKVSIVYNKSYNPYYPESTEYEETIEIFENSSLDENFDRKILYEYNSDNQVKKIYSVGDADYGNPISKEFKYDEQGRLFEIDYDLEEYIQRVTEFDDKNQPTTIQTIFDGGINEVHYEYGELKNPYYALYKQYGILNDCRIIDRAFITPYVVKIEQHSSSNYFYDYTSSDGKYPEFLHYNSDGYEAVYEFNYR